MAPIHAGRPKKAKMQSSLTLIHASLQFDMTSISMVSSWLNIVNYKKVSEVSAVTEMEDNNDLSSEEKPVLQFHYFNS